MPIPIRESDAWRLAGLLNDLQALRYDVLPTDLDDVEIALVVDRRRQRLLTAIENLGLQVRQDLPAQAIAPVAEDASVLEESP